MQRISSTTQDHLDIADIKNNVVILKTGGAVIVIEAYAINFDLLSLQEQDAAIVAYSSLLNSLSFPIQVVIRSKRMDISDYLEKVKSLEEKQPNQKIKAQIRAYRSFIQNELVTKEQVLDKNFYVVIPYKLYNLTEQAANPFGFLDGITNLFGSSSKKSKINVDQVLQEASADLEPKKNFMVKELARIGIKSRVLDTTELIRLYYSMYNSETSRSQKLKGNVSEYTAALVEPKLAQGI